jgi:hypothetical protein
MALNGLFVSLVETVLHANDAEKQKLFFVTYPQYCTPADLLETLKESLKASTDPDTNKRMGSFLIRWIENCPEGTSSLLYSVFFRSLPSSLSSHRFQQRQEARGGHAQLCPRHPPPWHNQPP